MQYDLMKPNKTQFNVSCGIFLFTHTFEVHKTQSVKLIPTVYNIIINIETMGERRWVQSLPAWLRREGVEHKRLRINDVIFVMQL